MVPPVSPVVLVPVVVSWVDILIGVVLLEGVSRAERVVVHPVGSGVVGVFHFLREKKHVVKKELFKHMVSKTACQTRGLKQD